MYRHAEIDFRRALAAMVSRKPLLPAHETAGGGVFLSVAVPIAFHHREANDAMLAQCLETCLLITRNPWEVLGAGLVGGLCAGFLHLETTSGEGALTEAACLAAWEEARSLASRVRGVLQERCGFLHLDFAAAEAEVLSRTLAELAEKKDWEWEPLFAWICQNASSALKAPVSNPAQGYVLSLVPAALAVVLKCRGRFGPALAQAVELGKEAVRLGALTGAWAGAVCGISALPQNLKTGLVNARELKLRAEALAARRPARGAKDLYAMEMALTQKETEDRRKHMPKVAKKAKGGGSGAALQELMDGRAPEVPAKEDTAQWRKFQKDKTRKKRDRRRNLDTEPDWG